MPKNCSNNTALHDTAEQFHILVDSVEEYAIYLLDPHGNVISWNTGAEKIKGYSTEEIIGKNFASFYTADDVAAGKPQRNLREATRRGYIRDQGLRVRKDGSTFEAEVIITALRDDAGKIRGFSKVTRDITTRFGAGSLKRKKLRRRKRARRRTTSLPRSVTSCERPLPLLWQQRHIWKKTRKNFRRISCRISRLSSATCSCRPG